MSVVYFQHLLQPPAKDRIPIFPAKYYKFARTLKLEDSCFFETLLHIYDAIERKIP
jgi:hypothetical protein